MVEGVVERFASSTRARCCWSRPERRVERVCDWTVVMVMFGAEVVLDVSMAEERWECAVVDFWVARARRASAFFGDERRVWERARVRHLGISLVGFQMN